MPEGGGFRITELWAYVSLDDGDNNEGIVGYQTPMGMVPAIGADKDRVQSLRPLMESLASQLSHPIELRRFATMTVVDTIGGDVALYSESE